MFCRDDCHHINRCKQPFAKGLVLGRYQTQVYIATFKAFRDTGAAVLNEVDFYRGMLASIARHEIRKQVFDMLCAATNSQCAAFSALQDARTLDKGLDFIQYPPSAPQQVLALRSQFDPPTDTIEQRN